MTSPATGTIYVYVGAFTGTPPNGRGRAEGISVFRLDLASGVLTPAHTVSGVDNPSFLALHPSRPLLYAVNAVTEGTVSAFAIDEETGGLTFLNRQSSHGAGPCHVSIDRTGRWALTSNYGSGSIARLPIQEDGSLGSATAWVQHEGGSVHERQQGPHAHSITPDPDGRVALVADLGLDRVMLYRIDGQDGALPPNEPPWAALAPGAGPRHLAFHPTGRFVYVINEIGSTITAFAYDATRGALTDLQTVPTLPPGFAGDNSTADIHVHPTGRFVYGSNRGHDSLVLYAIDEASGRLAYIGHQPTQGHTPRNFALDRAGDLLFVANQDSDTIVAFRIDQTTGRLTPTGQVVETPSPVCIKLRYA